MRTRVSSRHLARAPQEKPRRRRNSVCRRGKRRDGAATRMARRAATPIGAGIKVRAFAIMKIVHVDEVPLLRGLEHRGGTFNSRTLVQGKAGAPGNFKSSLSWPDAPHSVLRRSDTF